MLRFGPKRPILVALLAAIACGAAGCEEAYYRAQEALGKHKRDLLVERVEAARDGQEDAKEQFRSALQRFSDVVEVQAGELQEKYDRLSAELDRSETKADVVRQRIAKVHEVAEDLFDEWEDELDKYSNDELRLSSEISLRDTQKRYAMLLRAMKRAEGKMGPVLDAFRDQVLFLKHNLNARAVASLEGTVVSLEADIAQLIDQMDASIKEANAFIEAMGKPE